MAYIGFELSPGTSDCWSAFPGALLHITLAHFDKPSWEQTRTLAHRLRGLTRGVATPVFMPERVAVWPEVGPVLLLRHSADLMEWRCRVLYELAKLRIPPSRNHDYTPHMTLGDASVEEPAIRYIKPIGLELCGCPTITRVVFPFLS